MNPVSPVHGPLRNPPLAVEAYRDALRTWSLRPWRSNAARVIDALATARETIRLQGHLGGGQSIDLVIEAMVSNTEVQLLWAHRAIVEIDREWRPIVTAAEPTKRTVHRPKSPPSRRHSATKRGDER